mgnify:CR=1 FL=1
MSKLKFSVVGVGYLGAVHATAMASIGFDVVGIDVDAAKIASLLSGTPPFYEPGFNDLLAKTMDTGRLVWSNDIADVADCDVHFVCVGTPQLPGSHGADLRYVNAAVSALIPHLKPGSFVAGKSTVPVGTAARLSREIEKLWTGDGQTPLLLWNPEFLREGFAVEDTLRPDRIVIGIPGGEAGTLCEQAMRAVYVHMVTTGIPMIVTDLATAELVKVAANAFLATKISFINAMAEVCEAAGGDVTILADAIGYDARIGRRFLGAGVGFGGGCLPKDIRAFSARAGELGVDQALVFLSAVDDINTRRRDRAIQTARSLAGGDFSGQRVTVLGAAFKPDSDDVRDSPALDIAARIHNEGAIVVVHDPKALDNAALRFPTLAYEPDLNAALAGAELVLLLTEWKIYRELEPRRTAGMVSRAAILDGRNVLDGKAWRAAGWTLRGMGREHGPPIRKPR